MQQVLMTITGLSIVSLISLYLAFLGFLPEIVIEGVINKTKHFSSESKLKIKNNGRITAREVRADVHDLNVQFGGITIQECAFINCGPQVANKLSSGETTEFTIRPGLGLGKGQHFDKYSYTLTLKYQAQLLVFKRHFLKKWGIELKNYPDGYSWEVTII